MKRTDKRRWTSWPSCKIQQRTRTRRSCRWWYYGRRSHVSSWVYTILTQHSPTHYNHWHDNPNNDDNHHHWSWSTVVMDRPLYFAAVVTISFFFLLFFPRLLSVLRDIWCGLSANLMSGMCCTQLAENTGHKNCAKIAICAPSQNFVWLYLRN